MRNLKILQGFGGDQSNLCDLQVLLNICMQKFTFTKKKLFLKITNVFCVFYCMSQIIMACWKNFISHILLKNVVKCLKTRVANSLQKSHIIFENVVRFFDNVVVFCKCLKVSRQISGQKSSLPSKMSSYGVFFNERQFNLVRMVR